VNALDFRSHPDFMGFYCGHLECADVR
jgi:hypothetical protein